jgi:membrane protein required for beta-lactamase induction
MNLIALFLGLGIERLVTNLLHLREPRWFDAYFDWGLKHLYKQRLLSSAAVAVVMILVLVLPVLAVSLLFADRLFGVLYITFAVLILLLSLGPRDLVEEVDEFCEAKLRGDEENAHRVAKELVETSLPDDEIERAEMLEEAIFVQANNRVFGVVFWFMILGPVGAWMFRVSDLMRRRAVFECGRVAESGDDVPCYGEAVQAVHGVFSWVPARLLAVGYALSGHFESAVSDWRAYYLTCADKFFVVNDRVVACVGRGAMGETGPSDEPMEVLATRGALQLVTRTLIIWLFFIAILTLFGWAV